MNEEFPVTVAVERGGRVEEVQVGSAVRSGDGFVLRLSELRIHAGPAVEAAARRSSPIAASPGGGMTLPNYGRSKGQPVAGAWPTPPRPASTTRSGCCWRRSRPSSPGSRACRRWTPGRAPSRTSAARPTTTCPSEAPPARQGRWGRAPAATSLLRRPGRRAIVG